MFVDRLRINNVGQFASKEFRFQPGFNLIIGENGSGKSTILRSLVATLASRGRSGGKTIGFVPADIRLGAKTLEVRTDVISERNRIRKFSYERGFGPRQTSRTGDKSDVTILYFPSDKALSESLKAKKSRRIRNSMKSGTTETPEEYLYEAEKGNVKFGRHGFQAGSSRSVREFVRQVFSEMEVMFEEFDWRFEAYDCTVLGLDPRARSDTKSEREKQEILRTLEELLLRSFSLNPEILSGIEEKTITVTADGFLDKTQERLQVSPRFSDLLKVNLEFGKVRNLEFVEEISAEVKLTPKIVVKTPEGPLPLQQLSDGEKRLFSLFVEIAREISLSNNDEIDQIPAIILIDEIDVHLHPKWQRLVVPALQKLFPACQIIATTHSPFVIQAVPEERVQHPDRVLIGDFTDHGIEKIAYQVMGVEDHQVSKRYLEMLDTAKKYFRLLNQSHGETNSAKIEELRRRLDNLSQPYARNPAYQAFLEMKRETMLGADLEP